MEAAKVYGVPRRRALMLIKLVESMHEVEKKNGVVRNKKKRASPKRTLSKIAKRAKSSKTTS